MKDKLYMTTISLYFNCKLTHESVTPGKSSNRYNYPVMYPKKIDSEEYSQYKILIATIKSYSIFKFDVIIFNIEIESINNELYKACKNGNNDIVDKMISLGADNYYSCLDIACLHGNNYELDKMIELCIRKDEI